MSRGIKEIAVDAEGSSGAGLLPLIEEAVERCFFFGELLQTPSVQELRGTEHENAYNTLHLFAFGTLSDYNDKPSSFLTLTEKQILRLKLLTLSSLASQEKRLSYTKLHNNLGTSSNRELEDLVIEAVFQGLMTVKIDQKNQSLRILRCISRDVTTDDIGDMIRDMQLWREKCSQVVSSIKESSERLERERTVGNDEVMAMNSAAGIKIKEMMLGSEAIDSMRGSTFFGRGRSKRTRGYQYNMFK